jgi:hypothetical protein|uniref:Uncharacterized protein n=1 Tax=Picea glauca TaxID=3330 RepID=A0A124GPA8_PICGL|nr:hypothetical protein ABT39_MTgene1245 [Picea glauca]
MDRIIRGGADVDIEWRMVQNEERMTYSALI